MPATAKGYEQVQTEDLPPLGEQTPLSPRGRPRGGLRSQQKTALWFVLLVASSFTMSVGNKAIMLKYKFANSLLLLQVRRNLFVLAV